MDSGRLAFALRLWIQDFLLAAKAPIRLFSAGFVLLFLPGAPLFSARTPWRNADERLSACFAGLLLSAAAPIAFSPALFPKMIPAASGLQSTLAIACLCTQILWMLCAAALFAQLPSLAAKAHALLSNKPAPAPSTWHDLFHSEGGIPSLLALLNLGSAAFFCGALHSPFSFSGQPFSLGALQAEVGSNPRLSALMSAHLASLALLFFCAFFALGAPIARHQSFYSKKAKSA